jgi:hypothetical protein
MTPHKKAYMKEYDSKNKEHIKEYIKEYHLKNKEHIKEYKKVYMKKYHLKNKEKRQEYMKEYNKEYRLKNKEHAKEYRIKNRAKFSAYVKRRHDTEPNFKLVRNLRRRILDALKGTTKSAHTMELIGCTPDALRRHMESLFEPWMTWENQGRGGWHVDHIKACAKFDLTDPAQQRECFNYTNLQPLWAFDNLRKGAQ